MSPGSLSPEGLRSSVCDSAVSSGNVFTQQPSYYSDLDATIPTVLQVGRRLPTSLPASPQLTSFL